MDRIAFLKSVADPGLATAAGALATTAICQRAATPATLRAAEEGSIMRSIALAVVWAFIVLSIAPVGAQTNYPDKSIRLVYGFPAGADLVTRIYADRLAEAFGKPVVVDNVTGAAGNIGADRLAKAPPDGYTIGILPAANVTTNTILYKKLPYDPVKDLAPVTQIFSYPNLLFGQQRRASKDRARTCCVGSRTAKQIDIWARWRGDYDPPLRRAFQIHGTHQHSRCALPGATTNCDRYDERSDFDGVYCSRAAPSFGARAKDSCSRGDIASACPVRT